MYAGNPGSGKISPIAVKAMYIQEELQQGYFSEWYIQSNYQSLLFQQDFGRRLENFIEYLTGRIDKPKLLVDANVCERKEAKFRATVRRIPISFNRNFKKQMDMTL